MTTIKRTPDFNIDNSAITTFDKSTLLRVYENICKSRFFELELARAFNEKQIIGGIFLSLGQECVAAALAEIIHSYYIFPQHRAHDLFISLGANLEQFRNELRGLPSGFNNGRTGPIYLRYMKDKVKIIGYTHFIGENVPRAVGAALVTGEKTVCIFGDGAAEEDYVLASIGFAVTKNLPLLFICMDNDLSVLTKVEVRRSWNIVDIAQGLGMESYDLSDCPWTILKILKTWEAKKPLLLNCRVCRERWHTGTGIDGPREWERNIIVRNQLIQRGLEKEINSIEQRIQYEVEALWKN
jgi:pyruvate dehydrogenase E1 component alpha subunit